MIEIKCSHIKTKYNFQTTLSPLSSPTVEREFCGVISFKVRRLERKPLIGQEGQVLSRRQIGTAVRKDT
jgi:hypothetical protein